MPGDCDGKGDIAAVLAPHAGYMASGYCASYPFKALAEDSRHDTYVIIGPDHYGVPYRSVMCSDDFMTPLGVCETDKEICERLAEYVSDDPSAHSMEHSIEVEVPFIQTIDPEARIVPVMMCRQDPEEAERLAAALRSACRGRDVVYVASSDLVHYVPKRYADVVDAHFLETVSRIDPEAVFQEVAELRLSVCGFGPIATAMLASEPTRIDILAQTDSYESLGMDEESVVGYGAAAMYRR